MTELTIEAALSGGDPRKLENCDVVVELVLGDPARVAELLECVFSEDEIVRMRASDALEKVCVQRPELLEPFVERLLTDVSAIDQPSVRWHLAQILSEVSLTDDEKPRALEILWRNLAECDDWIVTNLTLQALAEFARADPALQPELVLTLRTYRDSDYKSVASRARKLLAEFER